jgi:hypothetical protein
LSTYASLCPVGATVDRIRRVFYVYRDEVDRRAGALEVRFSDGTVRLFDAGPDGERLAVSDQVWVDAFEGHLDDVNREYVAKSGKWTAFDVSDESPYADLIGARVEAAAAIAGRDGSSVGVVMNVAGRELRASAGADELLVDVRIPPGADT